MQRRIAAVMSVFSPVLAFLFLTLNPAFGDVDTLVYSWSSNVGELNPHAYSPNQMFAQAMVYEPLIKYGEGGALVPWLAEKWSISPDGRVYTFSLRKSVVFSDGTPFDAHAVRRNFDAVLRNKERHDWLELVAQIKSVEAVDDLTVRMILHNAYYPALQELSLIRPIRFMSPAAMPDDGDTGKGIKKAVGTGPWVLVKTRKGEYDLFERNERYWGTKPKFQKLMIKVIADPNTRAVALETGEIDLVHGAAGHGAGQLGPDAFARFAANPRYVTGVSQPLATRVIAVNSKREPTDDPAVRKSLQYAVNKEALVKAVFHGIETRADTLFSPDIPYCDLGLRPFVYNPVTAERLLDESGWKRPSPGAPRMKNGKESALDLCFVGNDAQQKAVAEVVQGDLKKIGIKVKLVGEEPDSHFNRQKTGEFGMIFNETWGAPYDPHSFCSSMRVPSHADYQAQLGLPMKPEIDAAIGKVLITTTEKERRELYRYILSTLHEQAVYIPLTYMTGIIVHKKNLKGVTYGPTMYEIPFERIERQ